MRTSLLPGLLGALATARRHGENAVRLFCVGATFHEPVRETNEGARPRLADDVGRLPTERLRFAAVLAGPRREHLVPTPPDVDVYDAKAVALEMVARIAGREASVRALGNAPGAAGLHPRGAAEVLVGDVAVGRFGPLHPEVIEALDLGGPALVVELDLDELGRLGKRRTPVQTRAARTRGDARSLARRGSRAVRGARGGRSRVCRGRALRIDRTSSATSAAARYRTGSGRSPSASSTETRKLAPEPTMRERSPTRRSTRSRSAWSRRRARASAWSFAASSAGASRRSFFRHARVACERKAPGPKECRAFALAAYGLSEEEELASRNTPQPFAPRRGRRSHARMPRRALRSSALEMPERNGQESSLPCRVRTATRRTLGRAARWAGRSGGTRLRSPRVGPPPALREVRSGSETTAFARRCSRRKPCPRTAGSDPRVPARTSPSRSSWHTWCGGRFSNCSAPLRTTTNATWLGRASLGTRGRRWCTSRSRQRAPNPQ